MITVRQITTLDDPELEVYSHLTEAQLRNKLEPTKGVFIAESPKVIKAALEAGCQPLSVLTEEKFVDRQVLPFAEKFGNITVYTGSRELLSSLTGYSLSRGMICAMYRPELPSVEAICNEAKRVVLVDGVVNATNTGAIFRAAAALGIDALLFTHTCCDPLNRRSVRVSMGTIFKLSWTQLDSSTSATEAVGQLRENGFVTIAMALTDKALPIDSPAFANLDRAAIVLGNEGDGLPAETITACCHSAIIPMQNGVDSLNVAAAAAVAFWQLRVRKG